MRMKLMAWILAGAVAMPLAAGCSKKDGEPAQPAAVPAADKGAEAKPGEAPAQPAGNAAEPTKQDRRGIEGGEVNAQGGAQGGAAAAEAKPAADAPPAEPGSPLAVLREAQAAAEAGEVQKLIGLVTPMNARMIGRIPPQQLQHLLGGTIKGEPQMNGGRAVFTLEREGAGNGPPSRKVVLFKQPEGWRIDLQKSAQWAEVDPGEADPLNKPVTLAEATEGIEGTGKLHATIKTSMGDLHCELYEDKAPKTVANFVGLARGKRGWKDPATGQWVQKPLYDGLTFHRVIPDFMIQGGDPAGNGTGGPGFTFEDEFDLSLRHDKGGLLSMANRGPNTNGSQFFVTEKETPWLDDGHTIFGACQEAELVAKMTRVPVAAGNKPVEPLKIETITFERK